MEITETKYSLINNETGEIEPIAAFLPSRKDNWERVYAKSLAELLEITGDERTRILACLLKEKDYENRVIATLNTIAEKSGVSVRTVKRLMTTLQENNFIHKISNGVYRFSPHVMVSGRTGVAAIIYREWVREEQVHE